MEATRPPMIRAAQPLLPDMEELLPYLREIWESRMLTNNGALHARLEQALKARLMVERLQLTANGTLGLMCALRALQVSGRVITTPFTFVATVHALRWCGLEPVFADIDPDTLNLDPDRAAAAVGPGVTAILPVHCFGTPCDTTRLGLLARHHGLKLIYDAAHAFDVSDAGGSILRHGDASVVSFHATKVFSTSEGGAVVSATADTADRVARCRNFGFTGDIDTDELGLNAKLGELNAALGLAQLPHIDAQRRRRQAIDRRYREGLASLEGLSLLPEPANWRGNHAYFPVFVKDGFAITRDQLHAQLRAAHIDSRRYFYPLVTWHSEYRSLPSASASHLPVATRVANEVLCLPMHAGLTDDEQDRVIDAVLNAASHAPAASRRMPA